MGTQQWYYRKGNARFGPIDGMEIKKLAADGKLSPTDLLRGVGMTEWIPASKIKGLFSVLKPELVVEEELGLAPVAGPIPAVSQPVKSANEPAKQIIPAPLQAPPVLVSKPASQPAVQSATESTPPAFTVPAASNPFSQFGLEQPADPFANAFPDLTSISQGVSPFDNLVSSENPGQPLNQPQASSNPYPSTPLRQASVSFDAGPMLNILCLIVPFVVFAIVGYIGGIIIGFLPIRFVGIVVGVVVAKITGMVSGNCMLHAKIKNEIFALGYGGLIGCFILYIFVGAYFWAQINQEADKIRKGTSTMFASDGTEEENISDTEDVTEADGESVVSGEEEAKEEISAETREELERLKREKPMELELLARVMSGKGITVMQSLSPRRVFGFSFVMSEVDWWIFWLINAAVLIGYTAQATWAANCGYDSSEQVF